MKVEIITIGDEILIGQIVDTNSAYMARLLDSEGYFVVRTTAVGDDAAEIKTALQEAESRADIVLITGGLGPTKDDITKQTLCEYFDVPLVFSEEIFMHLEEYLAKAGSVGMNGLNRSQAYVPENAYIINNEKGTAPITWFEKNGKVIVSMPGVPLEMEWAMTKIIPKLKETFATEEIIHRNFIVYGYPESVLSIKLTDWENALPAFIKLAYLPSIGLVKLRLSARQTNGVSLTKALNEETIKLRSILGRAILAEEDITIEGLIASLLTKKGLTVATAESCTGGNIARLLTSVAGSSAYFKGSVVAYDNSVKENLLNVSIDDIKNFGVVSLPVVEQMAKGALALLETDLAVATSGIAGPDGGTSEKPVGMVCIAVATKNAVKSQQFLFGNQRDRNIKRSTVAALAMLKEIIDLTK